MHIDLKNKNALVCGSTQGIGKASAIALAEAGANVTVVARNEVRLEQVKNELPTVNGQLHDFLVADFQNPPDLGEQVQKQLDAGNVFHILVNNTGGPPGGDIFSAKIDEFENAFTQQKLQSSYRAYQKS